MLIPCPTFRTFPYVPTVNINATIYPISGNSYDAYIDFKTAAGDTNFVDTSTLNFTVDPTTSRISATIPLRTNSTIATLPAAGTGTTATVTPVVAGGLLTNFTSLVGGSGYIPGSSPVVSFASVATGGVAPTAIATVDSNGVVASVVPNTPGSGLDGTLTATIAAPTGAVPTGWNFIGELVTNPSAGVIKVQNPTIVTATATAGVATATGTVLKVTSETLTTAVAGIYTLTITDTSVVTTSVLSVNVERGTLTTGQPTLLTATATANTITIIVKNIDAAAAFNGTLVFDVRVLN